MTDLELVRAKLQALIGDQHPERVVALVHSEPPVVWQRARFNPKGKRFFTDEKTRAGERSIGWTLARAMRGQPLFSDTVALFAIFYVPELRAKTARADSDNLLKLVMDGATKSKHVWTDDVMVRTHGVLIDLDVEKPRTVLAICPFLCAHSRAPLLMETRCGS